MPGMPSVRMLERSLAWVVVATMRKVPSARTPVGCGRVGLGLLFGGCGGFGGGRGGGGFAVTAAGCGEQGDEEEQEDG